MTDILVVDDDPDMLTVVRDSLTDEGYTVIAVSDGVAALIAASQHAFDAAAIDVMLPEMTGFEICRRLREAGKSFPVILLTARDAVDDRIFGLDSGADDYLTKPFALKELHARLRAQLRGALCGSADSTRRRASGHDHSAGPNRRSRGPVQRQRVLAAAISSAGRTRDGNASGDPHRCVGVG